MMMRDNKKNNETETLNIEMKKNKIVEGLA